MEATELFLQLIQAQGWVSWIPHNIWDAYQAGLLPDVSVGENCPKNLRIELERNLPCPTFFEENQWDAVLDYCGMGGGRGTRYIRIENNVYYCVRRASIYLMENDMELDAVDQKERRKNFQRYGLRGSMYHGHLIVKVIERSAVYFAKLRDQAILRLNQGDPGDIVKVAKVLKIS